MSAVNLRRLRYLLVVLAAVCVLWVIAQPHVKRAREGAWSLKSSTNLRQILRAAEEYRDLNGHSVDMDTWAQELLDAGLITDDILRTPDPDTPMPCYFLVPAGTIDTRTGEPTSIRGYERPDWHDLSPGGSTGHDDTRIEWHNQPEYNDIINNLAHPDGTPYAPHLG